MPTEISTIIAKAREDSSHLDEMMVSFFNFIAKGDLNYLLASNSELQAVLLKHHSHPYANAYKQIIEGTLAYFTSRGKEALACFEAVFDEHPEFEEQEIGGCVYLLMASNYRSMGEFDLAIKRGLKAKKLINPEGEFGSYLIMCYYQLAEIHQLINELDQAELILREGLSLGSGRLLEKFRLMSSLGNVCLKKGDLTESEKYFILAEEHAESVSQKSRALYDLGVLYEKLDDYPKALDFAEKSFQLRVNNSLIDASSTSQILKGKILIALEDFAQAKPLLEEALKLTFKFEAKIKSMECYELLSKVYEELGNYKEAFDALQSHTALKSEIHENQQKEIFKHKNQEINHQKEIIEEIHQEIQSSISYAKGIQIAMLPGDDQWSNIELPHSILFRPKDVVSGDFYWLEVKGDWVIFAVADCTGHGVPGAMVSVVCINSLNRAVREFDCTSPADILDKTKELVVKTFEKSSSIVKDGMDISICALHRKNMKLEWAGANNPLYIIRQLDGYESEADQSSESHYIKELKPDKQPVGNHSLEMPFTNHKLILKRGDVIVLSTDGFADQFGGERGKKMKYRPYKQSLLSLMEFPILQWENELEMIFSKWRGTHDQIDDVCVLAVQV